MITIWRRFPDIRAVARACAVIPLLAAGDVACSRSVAVHSAEARPASSRAAGRSPLWIGLEPGSYGVGYRVLDDTAAPVHVWYPAAASRDAPVRFRDYVGQDSAKLESFLRSTSLAQSTIDSLFATPLNAVASAAPLKGRWPLVLVAQGNQEGAVDQAVFSEYLASEGLVVVTTSSPTVRRPMEREDQVGEFADLQASELARAISIASSSLPVDTTRIGIVGHSFGARSALLLAMIDPRVKAIVSLDGGIGTASAVESFRNAKSFRSDAGLPPIIHFYEELDAFMKPDFTLLRGLKTSSLVLMPTQGMHHIHFTTYGFVSGVYPGMARVTHANEETPASVRGVATKSAAFLRCNLLKRCQVQKP